MKKIKLGLIASLMVGSFSFGATLSIYKDGAIYKYVPIDNFIGFISRAKASCANENIALINMPNCPESNRLCKEKLAIDELKSKLQSNLKTLEVLRQIEKSIKPTELDAKKWIAVAKESGEKEASLIESIKILKKQLRAKERLFSMQVSSKEPLFLARGCKTDLTLIMPPNLIKVKTINEAKILDKEIEILEYLSLRNRSGVDISIKRANIYMHSLHNYLKPIHFNPQVVRIASKVLYKRARAIDKGLLAMSDTRANSIKPKDSRHYTLNSLVLPSNGEAIKIKLYGYKAKVSCEDIAYPYKQLAVFKACSFKPQKEIINNSWIVKDKSKILSDRVYGEYDKGNYLLYIDEDRSLAIRRRRLTNQDRSSGIFGNSIKRRDGVILTIINKSKEQKSIKLIERIPVSTTEKIRVKLLDVKGAKQISLDKEGRLELSLKLEPKEAKEVKVIFEIKYPKEMKIIY